MIIAPRVFNDATSRKRNDMAKRLKPKYWRSGKRAGQLRSAGRSLPFSLEEFRAWCVKTMREQGNRCYYCPRPIDVLHFEPDHYVPLEYNGDIGLENLVAACEDCNRLKGATMPDDFIKLRSFLEHDISHLSAGDITKRLRAGSMGIRLQYHLKVGDQKKPAQPTHQLTAPAKTGDMFDDF
jgi:5-methylcytosine-specific restriction endonuclease McrA